MTKQCEHCSAPVPEQRNSKYCSDRCGAKARSKRHYRNNPDQYRTKRQDDSRDWRRHILYRVKSRAKKSQIPFELTVEDIIIPEFCPVLGLKLVRATGRGGWQDSSPSLDRIHPDKGYIKGNVRVISARANLIKSNASELELSAVLQDSRSIQKQGTP